MPTGQDPSMMPGQEFATPEERAQLAELAAAAQEKMASLQSIQFMNANEKESANNDVLRQLFAMMTTAGVDLTSEESVNMFLEQIKASNPNMAADFEESLNALLGNEEVDPINQNETLPESIRGPV